MTMSQTMTEEQIRELIQGPQDVEWKYVLPLLSSDCWVLNHSLRKSSVPPSANDDRYEMRRECQEILPGLILGPLQAAKSLDVLQGLGVTHVYVPPTPPTRDRSGSFSGDTRSLTGCAFETQKRHFLLNHDSRMSSNIWS